MKIDLKFDIPESWLEEINRRYGESGVPHICRPMDAIRDWCIQHNCSIRIPSPTATRIFSWFEQHSPLQSHNIGSLFTGLFYYDSYFWPVEVPLAYGNIRLDFMQLVRIMPESIKRRLLTDSPKLHLFCAVCVNCLDYGYGADDILNGGTLKGFARELFVSADRTLRATVQLLADQTRFNGKAMELARMTTEIAMKCFIAAHGHLDQRSAIALKHDLGKAADECRKLRSVPELDELQKSFGVFPNMGQRYSDAFYEAQQLWTAYGVAQCTAVLLTRSLTDRDSRSQFYSH